MVWETNYRRSLFWGIEPRSSIDSISYNEKCFIRKDHKCGKLFGASKSCFIACPTDDNLEPILELMSEKLSKVGIEPIIAVKERAYGQDIFCTKICGKIIEARFCIVILDDTIEDNKNIPNPNVYYEYGLMTSLRKHIIPLQKENLDLAFNIQSYDTIKYTSKNIASELDRAIKDAVRLTEAQEKDDRKTLFPEKTILRKLELVGFELRDREWFLHEVIEDTDFKGFAQYKKIFYLYLGKIDEESEFQDYLDDLGVVLYRTDKKIEELEKSISDANKTKRNITKEMKEASEKESKKTRSISFSKQLSFERELQHAESILKDKKGKVSMMSNIYVGFIINPKIEADSFISEAQSIIDQYKRYKLCTNSDDVITLGGVDVLLSGPAH